MCGQRDNGGIPPLLITLPVSSQGPCFRIQTAPDPLSSPSLLPSGGCHTVAALVRGPLLFSCPTGQDALSGTQLRQWPPSNLSPRPRRVLNDCFPKMSENIECLGTWEQSGYVLMAPSLPLCLRAEHRTEGAYLSRGFPRL